MSPRGRGAVLAVSAGALLGACSVFRWSGHPKERELAWDPEAAGRYELGAGTATARRRAAAYLPAELPASAKDALFYSDLGPDSVDVSGYPAVQRRNYAVYAKVCSQCHSLARSINAPMVERGYWRFYLLGMRARSRVLLGEKIGQEDALAILDFLEYDSRVRKAERRRNFEDLTEELERRFNASLRERMRSLQGADQPRLLR